MIFTNHLPYILVIFIAFSTVLVAAGGCSVYKVTRAGFDVVFRNYPAGSREYRRINFFRSGYKNFSQFATTQGVTSVNFYTRFDPSQKSAGVFGITVPEGFSAEMTGWFMARKSGKYEFSCIADDAIGIKFGADSGCCGELSDIVSNNLRYAYSVSADKPATITRSFNLVAGQYYPIKIVYMNYLSTMKLNFSYTDPDGDSVAEVGSDIFQILQVQDCGYITVSTWTETFTTSRTVTGTDGSETVIVKKPPATASSFSRTGTFTTNTKGSFSL